MCTNSSAKVQVRENVGDNGCETWRRLHEMFSLPVPQHASLSRNRNFRTEFKASETKKSKHEQQAGQPLPENVPVATLMIKTVGAVEQHLRPHAATLPKYAPTRDAIEQCFPSRLILRHFFVGPRSILYGWVN